MYQFNIYIPLKLIKMNYSELIEDFTYYYNGLPYLLADKPNLCFIDPNNRIYFFTIQDVSKMTNHNLI